MSLLMTLKRPPKVTQLSMLALMLMLGACKQNEFFEKAQLSEISTTKAPGNENTVAGTEVSSENETGDTNGGLGTNQTSDPVATTPVVTAPVVTIPIETTPILNIPDVAPPVVLGPIDTNPIATTPVAETPVATTPVVEAPVATTPVVEAPVATTPVVEAPVATTPVVTTPSISLLSRSENFVQNTHRNGDVDILWVVDDSGSMADNQTAIGQNFQLFIDQFIKKDIDFKMAITTTDGTRSRNGKMVGDSHLLSQAAAINNKAAFLNNFSRWIKVGINGSGTEQGLKSASSFFDRYGSTFIRKDAFLAIIFISDEEDQSEKKVPEYLTKFLSLKANKGMVKAYSIVTQKIPRHAEWESIGTRYNMVSQVTGGASSDITQNFATTLQNLGGKIVTLVDQFALAETPYSNSLEVYVNNVKQNSGWAYDASSKSIKFLADNIPTEGASINIKYSVAANLLGSN